MATQQKLVLIKNPDLAADLKAFADAPNAGSESCRNSCINKHNSITWRFNVSRDGWTASTSGTINLGGGSVSAGSVSLSNGMMTIAVGKSQHSSKAAVSTVFGMDRTLNANTADSISATMNLMERL